MVRIAQEDSSPGYHKAQVGTNFPAIPLVEMELSDWLAIFRSGNPDLTNVLAPGGLTLTTTLSCGKHCLYSRYSAYGKN